MLKVVHAIESREAAQAKASDVVATLRRARLVRAASNVEDRIDETLAY